MKRTALAVAAIVMVLPAMVRAQTVYTTVSPSPYSPTLDTGSYGNIHTVAVLSGIGPNFDLVYSNSFFPKEHAVDITAWQINEIIEAELQKYLGERFRFVPVSYDLSRMSAVGSQLWSSGRFRDFVKTVPNDGVDAFIVFRPNTQGRLRLEQRYQYTMLMAFYEMQLVDPHSYEILARADGQINGYMPIDMLGSEYALESDLALSDDKIARLKPQMINLLKRSLVDTIRALQFGVRLPPSGDPTILEPAGPEIAAPAPK